jgi:hypothetical protein
MIRGNRWLLVAAGGVLAQAAILHFMGQPWISASGTVKLWQGVVQSSENSQQIADWYSLSHVVHGFIFYGVLSLVLPRRIGFAARLALALGIEIAWELLENTDLVIDRYREATISLDYYGDSVVNSVADILAMMLGFWLASRLPVWLTVTLAVAAEVATTLLIRDGLVLNVLMLLWPVEAVRVWQSGG